MLFNDFNNIYRNLVTTIQSFISYSQLVTGFQNLYTEDEPRLGRPAVAVFAENIIATEKLINENRLKKNQILQIIMCREFTIN